MSTPVIGFAGLTHLGVCSSVATAEKEFRVIGYHHDDGVVRRLASGVPPVSEPLLDGLLGKNRTRLSFTTRLNELHDCDLVFVSLDVPTDSQGRSDLDPLRSLLADLFAILSNETPVVILSQIPPGFMRMLERAPGALFYQVETLVFGDAMRRALEPERIIIGSDRADAPLPEAYKAYLKTFDCPALRMRFESAELCKISINCFLVSSVTTTNMLAELCENIGADWSEIIPALRLDRRIGQYAYLKPGLGIGGGNLERDLATVTDLATRANSHHQTVAAWLSNSRHRRDWPLRRLRQDVLPLCGGRPTIALLGLAYKENTHSTKNSPALVLIENLADCSWRVFDPVVKKIDIERSGIFHARSAEEACSGADAAVIMTPWPEFRELAPDMFRRTLSRSIVIDPFGVLDRSGAEGAGLTVVALGQGHLAQPPDRPGRTPSGELRPRTDSR